MNVLVYICFHDQSPGNNGLWWVAMDSRTLDEQLGLPPTELRDQIKLYSHMNITDSMKVYHWTDIRRRC